MARAHFVKAARKAVPDRGIAVGDSYYWWKFRHSGKHYSKTPPKQSQLTQSEFKSTVYSIEEEMGELTSACEDFDAFRQDMIQQLEELRDNTQEKLDNMPSQLQDGDTGQMLQGRVDSLEEMIGELESLDLDIEEKTAEETKEEYDERVAQRREELVEEVQGISYNGE